MRKKRIKMIKIMVIVFIIVTTLVSVTALSNGDRGKYASFTEVYVKPGDTLWGIGQRYGKTVAELVRLYPWISNPNLIYAGQEVRVQ